MAVLATSQLHEAYRGEIGLPTVYGFPEGVPGVLRRDSSVNSLVVGIVGSKQTDIHFKGS